MTQPDSQQVDINDVIDEMSNQIANLSRQNAILAARLKAALGTTEPDPAPASSPDKAIEKPL